MALSVDIEKKLGDFQLRVAFETAGALLALLGASGSGKSVTLRCIAGLLRPDRGRIVLNGRVLFDSEARIDLPPQARRVGCLFQSDTLFPHRTVLENVMLGCHARPRAQRRALAEAQLARFRLSHLADSLPAVLSGGERQRCALARTLAAEPEALLLDEPFSALDEYLKWQLELELARTLDRYGGDAILVTHSRDEACRLAKSVCVLSGGRSEPLRSTAELMRAPGSLSAALLSGCKNVSPVTILPDGRLRCEDWGWTLPAMPVPAGLTHVGIRAHSLRPGPGELSLDCAVERVIDNVFSQIVILNTPGTVQLRMELPAGSHPPTPFPHSEESAEDGGRRGAIPPAGTALTVHARPEDLLLLTGGDAP